MPLEVNVSDEFPGALCVAIPPIGAGDCTNFDTFEELLLNEENEAGAVTIRSGIGWCSRSKTDIETTCEAI